LYLSVAVTGDNYCTFGRINNIRKICRGEPENLANWTMEFGKICSRKLWSLAAIITPVPSLPSERNYALASVGLKMVWLCLLFSWICFWWQWQPNE